MVSSKALDGHASSWSPPTPCVRCTTCSSPARSTRPTSTPPRYDPSSPRAGAAAWPRASTPTGEGASSSADHARGWPGCGTRTRWPSALPVIRRLLVDDATRLRCRRRHHRRRRHAAVGGGRPGRTPQGGVDELRSRRRLERTPRRDQCAGHRACARPRAADPQLRTLLPGGAAVELHRGARPRPGTGDLIGAIDLTGGVEVASGPGAGPGACHRRRRGESPGVAAAHRTRRRRCDDQVSARLRVLGADRPRWQFTDERGHRRTVELTPRHADILVLLSQHPEGLSADHLAMMLDDKDLDVVTVRAEMSRLQARHRARPGGFAAVPTAGTGRQRRQPGLRRAAGRPGRVRAGRSTRGALLPQSMSPAVARLRTELSTSLRTAVIATGDLAVAAALAGPAGGPRRPRRVAAPARRRRCWVGRAGAGPRSPGGPRHGPGLSRRPEPDGLPLRRNRAWEKLSPRTSTSEHVLDVAGRCDAIADVVDGMARGATRPPRLRRCRSPVVTT